MFTISLNSLYRGSLYQGLSVLFLSCFVWSLLVFQKIDGIFFPTKFSRHCIYAIKIYIKAYIKHLYMIKVFKKTKTNHSLVNEKLVLEKIWPHSAVDSTVCKSLSLRHSQASWTTFGMQMQILLKGLD